MANKTIAQLPLQTGVTDLDLFAIVDSGETTTSSITRSEFMSGATDTTFQNITLTSDSVIYSPPPPGRVWGGFIVVDTSAPGTIAKGNNTVSIANNGINMGSVGNNTTIIGTAGYNMNSSVAGRAVVANAYGTNTGNRSTVIGGTNGSITNGYSFLGSSYVNGITGNNSIMISGAYGHDISGNYSNSLSTNQGSKTIAGSYNTSISNNGGELTTTGANCGMHNSKDSYITGSTQFSTMISCSGRTATSDFTTYVETLEAFDGIVMTDYANLNFTGDTAAAAGGVPLGGLYHDAGAMRIRIT